MGRTRRPRGKPYCLLNEGKKWDHYGDVEVYKEKGSPEDRHSGVSLVGPAELFGPDSRPSVSSPAAPAVWSTCHQARLPSANTCAGLA